MVPDCNTNFMNGFAPLDNPYKVVLDDSLVHLDQGRATFQSEGQMTLSGAARGPEWQTKTPTWGCIYMYITILLLQSRQISDTAGAACHEEVFQCPARGMSSTRQKCHWDGGPRAGSEGETSCTAVLHFGEELFATVGVAKYGYDALNMRNVFMKISRREGDVAEEGQWRRVV